MNLALARGNVGRDGAGLMPIRGHSGVQGGAEMGAGFSAGTPFRRANLADMLEEYLPFGVVAAPLFQT